MTPPHNPIRNNTMKHPHQITLDHAEVTNAEVDIVRNPIMSALERLGIKFTCKISCSSWDKGRIVNITFDKPLVGRDWKQSRIHCTGISIHIQHGIGADEKKVNGMPVFDKSGNIVTIGPRYAQYDVYFRFTGTEIKYRGRNKYGIQDRTMNVFDYDDDLEAIDFTGNIDYLRPLVRAA